MEKKSVGINGKNLWKPITIPADPSSTVVLEGKQSQWNSKKKEIVLSARGKTYLSEFPRNRPSLRTTPVGPTFIESLDAFHY